MKSIKRKYSFEGGEKMKLDKSILKKLKEKLKEKNWTDEEIKEFIHCICSNKE